MADASSRRFQLCGAGFHSRACNPFERRSAPLSFSEQPTVPVLCLFQRAGFPSVGHHRDQSGARKEHSVAPAEPAPAPAPSRSLHERNDHPREKFKIGKSEMHRRRQWILDS
eukprot:scaffold1728_cov258-Pinguiococcus_pyrenoidosus.AAC.1